MFKIYTLSWWHWRSSTGSAMIAFPILSVNFYVMLSVHHACHCQHELEITSKATKTHKLDARHASCGMFRVP